MCGEPCKPTGNSFKATGTIRVQIGRSDGAPAQIAKMFLTPNTEYSASHAGKQYAVFFRVNGGGGDAKSTSYESGEGVPICVQDDFEGLIVAATQQTAVEVDVVEKPTTCTNPECKQLVWKLRAITIPAAGKKR